MSGIKSQTLTLESLRRKNFKPHEFVKSRRVTESLADNNPNNDIPNTPNVAQLHCGMKLADKMQELRDAIKKPFDITNGFRSPQLNKIVGGSKTSKHMQFLACDFNISGMTQLEGVMAIQDSGVSVDRCFVERGCIHVQVCMLDKDNANFFGFAEKIGGEWVVTPLDS